MMHLVHRKHHHMRPFHFVTMFFRTWWYNFWGYAFLMWCLWRERNWRMFEDMESSDDQLLALLVAPFLTGLGLGDSPLVILYLCSLAHSFVINIFSFCFLSSFSVFFLTLPYDFLHEVVFLNIHLYYLSKKKKICVLMCVHLMTLYLN